MTQPPGGRPRRPAPPGQTGPASRKAYDWAADAPGTPDARRRVYTRQNSRTPGAERPRPGAGAPAARRPARKGPRRMPPRRGSAPGGRLLLAVLALVAVAGLVIAMVLALSGRAGGAPSQGPSIGANAAALPEGGLQPLAGPPWVIALDGGHGGNDVGAVGIISEVELIHPTIQKLYALLEADPDFTPVLTRGYDEGPTNTQRTEAATAAGASMLLSIHGNSDGAEATNGFECFPVPPGRAWHGHSLRLARLIAGEMGAAGARLRGESGVRYMYFDITGSRSIREESDYSVYDSESFGILEKAQFAAVLAEQCFVTNAEDVAAFAGDEGTTRAAECYYRAIRRFFDTLGAA